ncbi:MAG: SufD family Fe-S cluster assembly protein, partial [Alphaproteobacteria bacterium]|nr:SufD family Fe-S cluster assembly protein [Alphaproteobacteria bacterium]
HNEDWHYTELPTLLRDAKPTQILSPIDFASVNPYCIVFRDGVFRDGVKNIEASEGDEAAFHITPYAPQPLPEKATAINAYNMAHAQDGLCLRVTSTPSRPLEVKTLGDTSHHIRHHIVLEAEVEMTLIKTCAASGAHNIWWDIELGQGARLNIISHHYGSVAVETQTITLAKDAKLHSTDFILAGDVVRHESHIHLSGAGAHAYLHNAILGTGNNHHDMRCVAHHHAAHTSSTINAHNVLDDTARGIFQGKVIVARDAQHVDATQNIRAMMLSDEAEMDTKPELEIYADDVACAHGATIGALDDDALFFLQARGVDKKTAKRLLIAAFIEQVVATIAAEPQRVLVQNYISSLIAETSSA